MDPWHREDSLNEDVQSLTVDLRVFHGSNIAPLASELHVGNLEFRKGSLVEAWASSGHAMPSGSGKSTNARPHLSGALVRDQAAS